MGAQKNHLQLAANCLPPRLPIWAVNLMVAAALAALLPLSFVMEDKLELSFITTLVYCGQAVILASSLNLINGVTGQFSLGHAAFMGIGAYACGTMLTKFGISESVGGNISVAHEIALAGLLLAGGVVAAIAGILIGVPALRLRGDYLAIATLGFGEIIKNLIENTESIGPFRIGASLGLHNIPIFAKTNLFWTLAFAVICVVCMWRLVHSTKGKALRAIREDEIAAAAMGVNTTYFKVLAFAVGSFFAGIAGGLDVIYSSFTVPGNYGFMKSFEIVVIVVIGGSGSVTGVVASAIFLTFLNETLGDFKEYHFIIYSAMLIIMMLVRPEGLLGKRELWWTRRRFGPRPGEPTTTPPADPVV